MLDSKKIKSSLETSTNVAVVAVALVVVGTFVLNYRRTNQPAAQLQPGLQKGVTLNPVPGVSYGDAPKTLLIAMSTRCNYCTDEIPFYKGLVERQQNEGEAVRVVFLFPEGADEVRNYAERNQLGPGPVAAADFAGLNLAGAPTVVLVDGDGKVLDFWVGRLSTDAEQEVIRSLSA